MTKPSPRPELATKTSAIDSDRVLLAKVIDHPSMQETQTRRAFVDMNENLKKFIGLTERQRAWVQRVAASLGIAVPKVEHPGPRPTQSAWDPEPVGTAKQRRSAGQKINRAVIALEKRRR